MDTRLYRRNTNGIYRSICGLNDGLNPRYTCRVARRMSACRRRLGFVRGSLLLVGPGQRLGAGSAPRLALGRIGLGGLRAADAMGYPSPCTPTVRLPTHGRFEGLYLRTLITVVCGGSIAQSLTQPQCTLTASDQ